MRSEVLLVANKFSLLGRTEYKLTDNLIVHIPTVGEIRNSIEDEIGYYNLVSLFIKTPCDAMIELDDMGLDYTQVREYDLFLMLFNGLMTEKEKLDRRYWKMIFPYLDINDLKGIHIKNTDEIVFVDRKNNVVIDEKIYMQLSDLLRQIVSVDKNMEYYKVPEIETRRYIIDRQRIKRQRALERELKNGSKTSSPLDGVLLLLINNCNFKYNFETVKSITLYDLHACLKQIYSDREIDGLMSGYWAGNVDLKKIDSSKLNRIIL